MRMSSTGRRLLCACGCELTRLVGDYSAAKFCKACHVLILVVSGSPTPRVCTCGAVSRTTREL
eukprot:12509579-Alexandrium_andersonii.AAC.1